MGEKPRSDNHDCSCFSASRIILTAGLAIGLVITSPVAGSMVPAVAVQVRALVVPPVAVALKVVVVATVGAGRHLGTRTWMAAGMTYELSASAHSATLEPGANLRALHGSARANGRGGRPPLPTPLDQSAARGQR